MEPENRPAARTVSRRRDLGRYRVGSGALESATVELDAGEAHHMSVRRLAPGDRIAVFDGAGNEAVAELLRMSPEGATARILERRLGAAESALELWLVQGLPVKLPRVDDVVRQATELGACGIVPVVCAHSAMPGGGGEVLRRKAVRWRRLASAAAKQCGRARVPEVLDPRPWEEVPWEKLPAPLLLLDLEGEPLAAAVRGGGRSVTLLVGPEGGWSEAEVCAAVARGARRVRLGPRVLRADSAGPAAIAVLQHLWGDLG